VTQSQVITPTPIPAQQRFAPSPSTPVCHLWNDVDSAGSLGTSDPLRTDPSVNFFHFTNSKYTNGSGNTPLGYPSVTAPQPTNYPATDAELQAIAEAMAVNHAQRLHFYGYIRGVGAYSGGSRGGSVFTQGWGVFDNTPSGSSLTAFAHPADGVSNSSPVQQDYKQPTWIPITDADDIPMGRFNPYNANALTANKKFGQWFAAKLKQQCDSFSVPSGLGGGTVQLQYPEALMWDSECYNDIRTFHSVRYDVTLPGFRRLGDFRNLKAAKTEAGSTTTRYTTETVYTDPTTGTAMTLEAWRASLVSRGIWAWSNDILPDALFNLAGTEQLDVLGREVVRLYINATQHLIKETLADPFAAAGMPVAWGDYDHVKVKPGAIYDYGNYDHGMPEILGGISMPVLYANGHLPRNEASAELNLEQARARIRSCDRSKRIIPWIGAQQIEYTDETKFESGDDAYLLEVLKACWDEGVYEYAIWGALPGYGNWDSTRFLAVWRQFQSWASSRAAQVVDRPNNTAKPDIRTSQIKIPARFGTQSPPMRATIAAYIHDML